MRFLVALMLLGLSACGPAAGWQGADVHLVDDRWIGAERPCGGADADLECRTVVEQAIRALAPNVRSRVTRAVLAALPATFVTGTGETRTGRMGIGISERRAVVVDLVDGSRAVIGLACNLPYRGNDSGTATLRADEVHCSLDPLDDWRNGNAPPTLPPGAHFG